MTDELAEIKAKCEQYMGYHGESVGMAEVHAVLSFIHTRAIGTISEVKRLEALVEASQGAYHLKSDALESEVKRLRAILLFKRSASGDEQDLYQQGMEAAAVIADKHTGPHGYGDDCICHKVIENDIRAAAKEQA